VGHKEREDSEGEYKGRSVRAWGKRRFQYGSLLILGEYDKALLKRNGQRKD
jgi:hypothetical protein